MEPGFFVLDNANIAQSSTPHDELAVPTEDAQYALSIVDAGGRSDVITTRQTLLGIASSLTVAAANFVATAHADDPPPAHRVKYTVTAADPAHADIYYLDNEPPHFAAWSHNPFEWTPNVKADVGPGKPWVFELMLANPEQWAMVSASNGLSPAHPNFHCELAVDGVVVVSKDGPKGALCSLRNW
jgi:hypothetical protein